MVSLVGSADAIQKSSPYHAWRPLFARLAGEVEGENREVKIARVEEWLGDDAELMPLLNVVLPLDLPETDRTLPMTGQARANSTNDLLVKILGRLAKRGPTLVAIDDAHWMDSASWALTLRLAREPGGLLLIVATRPRSTVFPEQHQLLTQIADEILDLGQLSDEEGVRLASQCLGVEALPGPVEALILRKAQGNPLYCEELARALVDSGLIAIEDGVCRIREGVDLENVGIPDSVEGIINHRVDRLDPSEQMALKVASVIGRLFRLSLLQDVYPIEPDRSVVPQHLVSLLKTELIQPEQSEPDLAYLFRHVITRDVVYDRLPFAHRRKLHHEVAEWYERSAIAELSSDYPLLAHHWSLAGNDCRAIDSLEKAGESALRSGAYQEAVDFLERAISLQAKQTQTDETAQRRQARWEYLLGEAHLSLGHLVQSREHTARALELLGRPIPTRVGLVGGYAVQVGTQMVARFGLKNRPPSGSSTLRLASSAYGLVSQLAYFDQDRGIGVYSALRSLNLAESSGQSIELARALAVMCVASGLAPAHALAENYRKRAFEVVGGLDDPPARAWVLQLTGMYDLGIGRWDRAKESLAEAVAINRRLGDWRRWEESAGEMGRLWIDLGHYDRAAATFQEFGEEAGRRGHDQSIAWGYHGRSRALIRQGRFEEAMSLIELSKALPAEALGIGDSILRSGLLAQLHVGRREWAAAKEAAEHASTLIRSSPPMVSYSLEGYAGVAETYLALWEVGALANGRKPAMQAIKRLATIARVYPVGRPRVWLCRARAHRLLGEPRRARRACRKALEGSERLQMPYEQAIALLESSLDQRRSDDERTQLHDQARAILETIGAVALTESS